MLPPVRCRTGLTLPPLGIGESDQTWKLCSNRSNSEHDYYSKLSHHSESQVGVNNTRLHVDCNLFTTQFLLSCSIITPLLCLPQIIMTLYMTLSTFRWILRPRTIKMERCFTLCIPFLRAPCSKPMVDLMDLIRPDHVQSHLGKFCDVGERSLAIAIAWLIRLP